MCVFHPSLNSSLRVYAKERPRSTWCWCRPVFAVVSNQLTGDRSVQRWRRWRGGGPLLEWRLMTVTGSNNKIVCECELECGRWKGKPVGGVVQQEIRRTCRPECKQGWVGGGVWQSEARFGDWAVGGSVESNGWGQIIGHVGQMGNKWESNSE